MDAPRPQEVCEFGEYRFTINYPPRYPIGERPENPEIVALLNSFAATRGPDPSDTPAREGWPDNYRRYTP